jgi:protein kinase-like protein
MTMSSLALESTFAGCRIEGVAGSGGMGVVYRATQLPLGRAVALKVVAPDRAADSTLKVRFEREARLASAIEHPNVIPVYGAGEQDGSLYLVMRWVEGTDLQAMISQCGALDPGRAARIVADVGAGLQAAHDAGLVHRDVKPANVLISQEGDAEHVFLSDFGLTLEISASTRLTQTGQLLGTVDFMAPEQFEGTSVDRRTDVYALGCVLHATLTGRPPFPRGTLPATMRAHLAEPPPRPSATPGVPAAFDAIVARALAKRPEDRYSSASELVEATLAAAPPPAEPRPQLAAGSNGGEAAPTVAVSKATIALGDAKPTIALADAAQAPTAELARPRAGRILRDALLATVITVVLAAVAGILLGVGPFATENGTGPVSSTEVRNTAESFALAYAREDDHSLRRLLSSDVDRVTPADREHGRRAVLREYRRQFGINSTRSYALDNLRVTGGEVGRARGRYAASLAGHRPITGQVVFGVRRQGGRPRIALIAVTPDR